MHEDLAEKVAKLPRSPGIYMFMDGKKQIIYVGKAKVLRDRVRSYFGSDVAAGSKTRRLIQSIRDLKYIEVMSEFEALILEAEMIKKHMPRYNINLKDDRSYLYIVVRREEFEVGILPKIFLERRQSLKPDDLYFGPFTQSESARRVLGTIRKVFPFRDCSPSKFGRYRRLKRPCLYGHLGLCSAPCTGAVTSVQYRKDVRKIVAVLSGGQRGFTRRLEASMNKASQIQDFERAKYYRDLLRKFQYLNDSFSAPQSYMDNPYLIEDILNRALDDLLSAIPFLKKIPDRIECFDVSDISGDFGAGAMVVAIKGRLANGEYRRFKIRSVKKPDDYEMMREVLRRRFAREKRRDKRWELPDLLVIDGGRGHVSAAHDVLQELGVCVPVIGLAKRLESVVYKGGKGYIEIKLNRSNEGLKLLQRLRDEAHRFSRRYHHLLRSGSI
ncbi:GIY-YIG nuclease family protein [candidate division WWE3 bacterium]|nr:GIY-YIG nuclease family protein [candidate division WWE3 bacterium]